MEEVAKGGGKESGTSAQIDLSDEKRRPVEIEIGQCESSIADLTEKISQLDRQIDEAQRNGERWLEIRLERDANQGALNTVQRKLVQLRKELASLR